MNMNDGMSPQILEENKHYKDFLRYLLALRGHIKCSKEVLLKTNTSYLTCQDKGEGGL